VSGSHALSPSGERDAIARHLAGLFLFAGKYFLSGPDEEVHGILSDSQWWGSLEESGLVDGQPEGESVNLSRHLAAFNSVCRIPGDGFVPPFEQAYHERKATVELSAPGECAKLFRAAGYEMAPYAGVQPDHIGHQLRFLSALLEREADCVDRGEEEAAKRVRTWQEGFLADRCWWWPRFAGDIQSKSPPFELAAAAGLLVGLHAALAGERPGGWQEG